MSHRLMSKEVYLHTNQYVSMKKLLSLALFCLFAYAAKANNGDTTVVKAFVDSVVVTKPSTGNNPYDAWVQFPAGKQYHKALIYMTFECPDNMDCAEWDYLDAISIQHTGGVGGPLLNWEIARFITPYGLYWTKGSGWKHGWYYDITDFATLLHDSIEVRYNHSGYEANTKGWKINISFIFIEGTPVRPVEKISQPWAGGFKYDDSIDIKYLTPKTYTYTAQTKEARLKIMQTGHGAGATDGCSEFCAKTRTVKYDGSTVNQRLLWRECGFNSLFPQAGTWLYDRGNWCPGASVSYDNIDFHNVAAGTTHDFDIDMEAVTAGDHGNQAVTAYMIEYGQPAFGNDVSLEAILAPSKEYEYNRINPICSNPVVVIRNNGTNAMTSAKITYGVPGGTKAVYNWNGNLAFLQTDTVTLTTPLNWGPNSNVFEVEVNNPNGGTDEYAENNKGASVYDTPPVYPESRLIVKLSTNKAGSETYYKLRNLTNGTTVLDKNNLAAQTNYRDTVDLYMGNCYSFEVYDDGPTPSGLTDLNKDGLYWWANTGDGTGSVSLNRPGLLVPFKTFNPDFGTKFIYQFTVGYSLDVKNINQDFSEVSVFPNPSDGVFKLNYDHIGENASVEVYNITGIKVYENKLGTSGLLDINLSAMPKGLYVLKLMSVGVTKNTYKLVLQ